MQYRVGTTAPPLFKEEVSRSDGGVQNRGSTCRGGSSSNQYFSQFNGYIELSVIYNFVEY